MTSRLHGGDGQLGTVNPPVAADPRRWRALAVLATIQFLLILDLTVVNVALPHIKANLGFATDSLPWVVNGYTVMAGGLLLLGGRLGDRYGRRRVFLIGVLVFAVASMGCGLATDPGMLVGGRMVQGAGEALAAPCGLALVFTLFTDARERNQAIGLWASLAAVGGTFGTLLSGALNDVTTWRWIFYLNVPVSAIGLALVPRLVPADDPPAGGRGRLDVAGATTVTGAMMLIVVGAVNAATRSWGSVAVVAPLCAGIALGAAFVVIESRVASPLVPLSFLRHRTRMVAVGVNVGFAAAFYANFYLLTLYMQDVRGWSPLQTGLAYLPYGLLIVVGGGLGSVLLSRFGARAVLPLGCALGAVGLFLLSGISVHGSYLAGVLPGSLVLGLGAGLAFPSLGVAALHGAAGRDSGLASGVRNTAYQVGGSFGLALLATLAARHTSALVSTGTSTGSGAAQGYGFALAWGAALMLVAAGCALLGIEAGVGRRAR